MGWRQLLLVSCLSAAMFLSMPQEGSSASVGISQVSGQEAQEGVDQKIFLQEPDASSFLKKHGKRLPKPPNELIAENRQKLWTDELHREYPEELQESESFAEVNEQKEKNREAIDQWHHWH